MNQLVDIIREDVRHVCDKIDFNELDGKTVLLTGASGLIGTYFLATVRELQRAGKKIKIFAIAKNKFPEYLSYFGEFADFLQGDITDYGFIESLPKADYIIHAGGYGQPGRFMEDQIKTIELNTTGTLGLFKRLKSGGKFIFLSTSEVYSGLSDLPYREDQIGITNTTHPRACYIEGKRCGEAIVNVYRQKGINAKSARLSLAYGPGTKKGDLRVINSFIYKGLQGKIDMLDHGEAKRTYCYVSDAVEIMWDILLFGKEPIYNVGGFSSVTIAELAGKIGTALNVPVTFPDKKNEGLTGAPLDVALDMTKVKNEFNKTEYVSLDDGLSRTIEWQKHLYNN